MTPSRPARRRAVAIPIGIVFWSLVIVAATTGNRLLIAGAAAVPAMVGIASIVAATKRSSVRTANRARLLDHGLPGTARVLSARVNGRINNHPIVELKLDVAVGDRPRYVVIVRTAISQLAVHRVEAGADIPVKVDPDDTRNVEVDLPTWRPDG